MFSKIISFFRRNSRWSEKPSYMEKGSSYGGLRIDIDEYYANEENREKLEEINKSGFPEFIKSKAGRKATPQPD